MIPENNPIGMNNVQVTETPIPNLESNPPQPLAMFDIQDIIPRELLEAASKSKKQEPKKTVVPENIQNAIKKEEEIEENFDDDDESESTPTDDELDITNDETIEKLIQGDLKAISKKSKEPPAKQPKEWHEHATYKKLVEKARNAGFTQEEIDDFIQETTDTKVLTTSAYTKNVEAEKEKYLREVENSKQEIDRLRRIERATQFDALPEVQEEFGKPMAEAVEEIKKILDIESIDVPISKLLMAKDKAALNEALKAEYIEEPQYNKLVNFWRNYKDTEYRYNDARARAIENLKNFVKPQLSENKISEIIFKRCQDVVVNNSKYKSIYDAVMNDITKYPEEKEVLDRARGIFTNIMNAMNNSHDSMRDNKWLNALADYAIDSEHAKYVEKKYKIVEEKSKKLEEQVKKLAIAHKKLLESGKGITGMNGASYYKSNGNGSHHSDKDSEKKFRDFLSGKIDIDGLI